MAISSHGVALKWGTQAESLTKKVDIKDFPDLFGDPNLLETTTLANGQQTYIPGILSSDLKSFTANYTNEDFKACNDDANKDLYYELSFSDGSKFKWQGRHTMGIPGKGVDEVIEMTINVVPSSDITFSQN